MIALNVQIWMLGGGSISHTYMFLKLYILNINRNVYHLHRLLRKRIFFIILLFFFAFFKIRVHFVKGMGREGFIYNSV